MLLGVDTGGTFTDFVWFDGAELRIHKVLSTPTAPEEAIHRGISELGLEGCSYHLIQGSTVATNAVLEGKDVATLYVTNRGLADVLTIGRQARRELYNLRPRPRPPPVAPAFCVEVGGRLAADGTLVDPLTDADRVLLAERVRALAPRAVAINFLFSFLDDRCEREVEALLPADLFISRSSAVLPEYREYERGIATWLNAWVGPLVQGYLARLRRGVAPATVSVMQSSGVTIGSAQAAGRAVELLLSGPAGGLMGARSLGLPLELTRLLTLDMGGTSTDVALIDGDIGLTLDGAIGGYPVAVPMVDMHTIGAGGGSIAFLDEGGVLQVGPESAGADPGPACYARGGQRPTVTDANLVLGRLCPAAFLGGGMVLDPQAAVAVVSPLAAATGVSVREAALGIVRVCNEHMTQALRVISVQRGLDPRDFALMAFGGAGGLHVCELAEALSMPRAVVPAYAGVLSALGMLVAPRGRQLAQAVRAGLDDCDDAALRAAFATLRARGVAELAGEGVPEQIVEASPRLDLRYRGQRSHLTVPYVSLADAAQAFHRLHERHFGHRMVAPVEVVNLRLTLHTPPPSLPVAATARVPDGRPAPSLDPGGATPSIATHRRSDFAPGAWLAGPLLVLDTVATTWVKSGWHVCLHAGGSLLLERK